MSEPSPQSKGHAPAAAPTTCPAGGGLEAFRAELHPAVVADILTWAADPELGRLYATLRAIRDRDKFLDTYAEAMLARHLLQRPCTLRVGVPTPSGKTCDFEVAFRDRRFYIHVKRLNTDRAVQRRLTVSSRLRYLERIARPYVVGIYLRGELKNGQMQRFVTAAAAFINHARVGDELVVRDDDGTELGGCRIEAPWQGPRVNLVIGLPSGFIEETPRIRRLMRKAYQQFMPGQDNIILISSSQADDAEDVDTALLGSFVERWDAHPPRGRRVAHGRGVDGFWYGRRYPESAVAGWFHFQPHVAALPCRLWFRPEAAIEAPLLEAIQELLGPSVIPGPGAGQYNAAP